MSETAAKTGARVRTLPPRDARGRFIARPGVAPKALRAPAPPAVGARGRVRALPSRDARGRFVAFPTTNAPSWYVLSTDAYRIPAEIDVMPVRIVEGPAPQPAALPRAKIVRRPRRWMHPWDLLTWIAIVLFFIGVGWYGLTLPISHR